MRGNGRSDIIKSLLTNGLSDARNYQAAVSYRTSKLIQREKVDEQTLNLKSVRHFG